MDKKPFQKNGFARLSKAFFFIIFVISVNFSPCIFAQSEGPLRSGINAAQNSISLSFFIPDVTEVRSGEQGDEISLSGFLSGGEPGDPQLPMYEFRFLVPEDVKPETINPVLCDPVWEEVPGWFDVRPVNPPVPLGGYPNFPKWGEKKPENIIQGRDIAIYGKNAFFPSNPLSFPQASRFRKWNLVYVSLTPLRFHPVEKRLQILRSGTIKIGFERSGNLKGEDAWKYVTPENEEKFWEQIAGLLLLFPIQ